MKREFFDGIQLNISDLNINEEWSKFIRYRNDLNLTMIDDLHIKYDLDGLIINYAITASYNNKKFICSFGVNRYQIIEYEEEKRQKLSTGEGKLVVDEINILSDNLKFFNLFPKGDYINYSLGYMGEAYSGFKGYSYYEITKNKKVVPIVDEELPVRGYSIIIHGMKKTSKNSASSNGGNVHIIR